MASTISKKQTLQTLDPNILEFQKDDAHSNAKVNSDIGNPLTKIARPTNLGIMEDFSMETMNIALPESMKHFVQEQVAAGGYSSVSEYIRELIRSDQKRKVEERIDALLLEGLDSGEPIPVTQKYWDEKKRKLTERLGKTIMPQ